jgi:CNT family concentrative nucleoside transporter
VSGIVEVLWGIGDIVVLLDVVSMLSKDGRATNPHTKFGALAIQVVFGVIVLCWGQASVGGRRRPTPCR